MNITFIAEDNADDVIPSVARDLPVSRRSFTAKSAVQDDTFAYTTELL